MKTYEVNFDGIVGPTHHYGGLAADNVASKKHALQISNPKAAAKQGLEKMTFLIRLGLKQALLPPHERPNLAFLKRLGFSGTPEKILCNAFKADPKLLTAVYSASSMWAANAATVSPSVDCKDRRIHVTPAN
ncbi:MAG: N-succinylarginine dihydrolase, partial [Gammaproteobacteria bacterium]